MELLLEAGIERVSTHVQALGDRIAAGARERGWEVLGQRTPDAGAGIVCIRKPGIDSRWVYARLREQGFLAAPRQGWVRLSPHFYVSPEDIERLLEALPESGPPAA
jgi:selenocysteine lyase/cysteine desulfurase